MSLKDLLKGADIYKLPDSLEKFIQEKTASGFGKIRLIPLAFPVFIMNPFRYADNFKDVLNETVPATLKTSVTQENLCPDDEVWQITNVALHTTVQADIFLWIFIGGTPTHYIKADKNIFDLQWSGNLWIEENMKIGAWTSIAGDLSLSVNGMIRYA